MPLDIIPKSMYPSVPNVPGVPSMMRNPSSVLGAVLGVINISNQVKRLIGAESTVWGVFDKNNKLVAQATSILSVEYRNSSRVSDYPIEQGAWASYNKVKNPYDVKVRMACDGTKALGVSSLLNPLDNLGNKKNRTDFINALDAASDSLDLYTIVTPEKTYSNANIEAWDYRRETSNGATVIIAELYIREVRETVIAAFSAPKSTSAAVPQAQGQVQAAPPVNQNILATAFR
jgi:hypothetical protein